MEYKIFLICLILGLSSGIIYDLLYVARFVVSKSDNLTFLNQIRRKRREEKSLKKSSERQINRSKKLSEKQKNKLQIDKFGGKKIKLNFDKTFNKNSSEKLNSDENNNLKNMTKNTARPHNMPQPTAFFEDETNLETDKDKKGRTGRKGVKTPSRNLAKSKKNAVQNFDEFKARKKGKGEIKEEKTGRIAERIFLIFCDAAYLLTVSAIFVAVSLKYDFYELRFYMFAAVGLGIAIYCKSLHKLIAFLTNKVYNKITRKRKISVKEYYERRKTQSNSGGNNG